MNDPRNEANHERARNFAASQAIRPSTSELCNLARSYLSALQSITELAKEVSELRAIRTTSIHGRNRKRS